MSRRSLPSAVLLLLLGSFSIGATAAAPASRKVIIDQDALGPGGSNLQAIAMLLRAPDVQLLGITVVSGDGWRDEEVQSALRLLEIADRPDVPVVPGAVKPLLNSPARVRAWETQHGKLFYKGAFTDHWPDQGVARRTPHPDDPFLRPPMVEGAPRLAPSAKSAAAFLIEQTLAHPGEVTVIAAGPLTNLALAARLDAGFAGRVRELVIMGGSLSPMPTDDAFAPEYANAPRREFNFRFDPEAASLVLHEPWPRLTVVPIDPTTRTRFRRELFDRIAAAGTPLARYLARYGAPFPMWDELAVAVWLDPAIVTRLQPLSIDVDTEAGAGYGNTLTWSEGEAPRLGERVADIVLDVDVPRLEDLAVRLLH